MSRALMTPPRPFYPLQQPAQQPWTVRFRTGPHRRAQSTPIPFQLRAHTAPAAAVMLPARASAATSPSPARSPARPQSPRRTSLPDRAGSASCDTAPALSSVPPPLAAALRGAPHCRTENPRDRSTPPASIPHLGCHPTRLVRSTSHVPYAETTTVSDWPPHAARCGKSTSSGWTRRENGSCREKLSGTHPAWCRRRRPDRSRFGKPAHTSAAEILRSARRRLLPSRPSTPRRSRLLLTVLRLRSLIHPRWLLPP